MNFILFSEGPLDKFFQWLGFGERSSSLFKHRILLICLFTWLPLLILTFISSNVKLNLFINDFAVHVRLLISLALLISAEGFANVRFQIVVKQFMQCNIISEKDHPKYHAMIASALKLSDSFLVEVLLFFFVITIGHWISNQVLPFDLAVWSRVKVNNIVTLTLPGYWYAFVSLPIFQFILLRWYYRLIIWFRFLWQVSQLKLQLNSLHPDKAGGIGFLSNHVYGLEVFLMAHSFLLAGIILTYLLNTPATLWQFRYEMISWIVILIFITLIPMTFFMRQLLRIKRDGTNDYNILANRYVTEFRNKWIDFKSQNKNELLGTADIQSLADLSNSFNVSVQMYALPLGKNTIWFLIIFTVLPFIPLIFTEIPLDKILSQIIGIVF